mmetsp:Transcript_48715/g.110559  ORF Transcript_48715/g.110559 Transcript_48715/m.110559 type:complete len:144 (+) Transcript_48715:156-587(+)
MAESWTIGTFGCCSVKDCGFGCYVKNWLGWPCIWCHVLEKAGLGGSCQHCLGGYMCGHLYSGYMRNKIAAKYNISEALCCSILTEMLCPYCSCYQYENEVLVKEKLTWGWCEVVSDVGGGGGGCGGTVAVLAGAPSRSEDMIR